VLNCRIWESIKAKEFVEFVKEENRNFPIINNSQTMRKDKITILPERELGG